MEMHSRTKKFILVTILLMALGSLGGYCVNRAVRAIIEKRTAIDMFRARQMVDVEKAQRQNDFSREYKEILEKKDSLHAVFLDDGDFVSTLERLEEYAKDAHIEVSVSVQEKSVKQQRSTVVAAQDGEGGADVEREKENVIILMVEARGAYTDIARYIGMIESMLPIASLEGVDISKQQVEKRGIEEEEGASEEKVMAHITLSFIQEK